MTYLNQLSDTSTQALSGLLAILQRMAPHPITVMHLLSLDDTLQDLVTLTLLSWSRNYGKGFGSVLAQSLKTLSVNSRHDAVRVIKVLHVKAANAKVGTWI